MKTFFYCFLIGLLFNASNLSAQALTCFDSYLSPFCHGMAPFAANFDGTGAGSGPQAQSGPNYDCLGTQGNPSFFAVTIALSGSVEITISNSQMLDIDYIMWGPFSSYGAAQLACDSMGIGGAWGAVTDCSYSTANAEIATIPTGVSGEVYILMVTNFANQATDISLQQTGGTGNIACNIGNGTSMIEGYVYNDSDGSCVQDSSENGVEGRLLLLEPEGYYTMTDSNGRYQFHGVGIDTYSVELMLDTFYWTPTCPNPAERTVIITTSYDTVLNEDFGIQINNYCSDLWVDVAMPILRPCFANNLIHVYYCNAHNATANQDSVEITVTIDTALTPNFSSLPWTSVNGNDYTFYIGNLDPGDCGSFTIFCTASCYIPVGATLCTTGEISPLDSCNLLQYQDSLPIVPPCSGVWDRSSLNVEGYCVGDTAVCFVITNTGDPGTGDMQCYSEIRVFQDTALFQIDSLMLNGGDSLVLCFPANGFTWRLEVDQHPMHPGNSHPNAVVELCGNSAAIAQNWTPGLVNQFPLNDGNPNTDIDCAEAVASFDPNDKRGFPLGISDDHIIAPNTDIEYMIRFQNTGTDTAFTVVIRDTLPPTLDLLTVESGASSHNYSFRIYGPRVLEWTFENIMLPDSNVNEPLSHGFISFKVEQVPNLPNGTFIHNDASIFFDFNAPIITNISEHLVDDSPPSWVITDLHEVQANPAQNWDVNIYPNPTRQMINIRSEEVLEEVRLITLQGQIIQQINSADQQVSLDLSGLPQAMYILDIKSEAGRITKRILKME